MKNVVKKRVKKDYKDNYIEQTQGQLIVWCNISWHWNEQKSK